MAGIDRILDLSKTSELTLALLSDTRAWRQRLVEEFDIGSRWHAVVTSGYQLELPRQVLNDAAGSAVALDKFDGVRVLLPVTTRPKMPLLDFGVRGPGHVPAHLLLRVSIAAIQAEYLARLRDASPDAVIAAGLPDELVEAICVFTPQVYREFDPDVHWKPEPVARYLSEGLQIAVPPDVVSTLVELQREAGEVLIDVLREPGDPLSSSEQVLLALPRLEPLPKTVEEVERVVHDYVAAVVAASRGDDIGLLVALGEYGRRWEAIVETVVPIHEPATVTIVEQRPLNLQRRITRQRVALGDARSAHAQFAISDPAVELQGFDVMDPFGGRVGVPHLEGVRETAEALALYSGDPDRPYFVDVELKLRPALDLRVAAWAFELLVLAAAIIGLTYDGRQLAEIFALLTVPTTFAVALLMVREQTSLGAHLMRWSRRRLLVWAGALWVVVFVRLAW